MQPGQIARAYLVPMYSQAEVAQLIRATPSTVHRWLTGYTTAGGHQPPVITGADHGRGFTVPFIGFAEAFVLNAFLKAGLPMQRIRPAVNALIAEFGIDHVLASRRLYTDGAEVLLESADPLDRRLVVARNGQAVFTEVVADYLRQIDFSEAGYASVIRLPQYPGLDVTVRPTVNGGRPTLARSGIAIDDVLGRVRAGETPAEVAVDYDLSHEDVLNLNRLAA